MRTIITKVLKMVSKTSIFLYFCSELIKTIHKYCIFTTKILDQNIVEN